MSLSPLARSPECERLLKFALDHEVTDIWEHPAIDCYINGHILSGVNPVGELDSNELVVHIADAHGPDKCSIHLSTVVALATAYIKYQYEAVAEAISKNGQSVDWALKDKPEGNDGRVMVYANIVAKYGHDSDEAIEYTHKYLDDNGFVEAATMVRLKARVLQIISEEQEAKILQQRQNSADSFLQQAGFEAREIDHEFRDDPSLS